MRCVARTKVESDAMLTVQVIHEENSLGDLYRINYNEVQPVRIKKKLLVRVIAGELKGEECKVKFVSSDDLVLEGHTQTLVKVQQCIAIYKA